MRLPDFHSDAWCLLDGEEVHHAHPETFRIPDRERRTGLQPGDLAKLMFRIAVDNPERPEAVERMWVFVRERTPHGYLGVLGNEPHCIARNEELWRGVELPFEARHVIDIEMGDEETLAYALEEPSRRWR